MTAKLIKDPKTKDEKIQNIGVYNEKINGIVKSIRKFGVIATDDINNKIHSLTAISYKENGKTKWIKLLKTNKRTGKEQLVFNKEELKKLPNDAIDRIYKAYKDFRYENAYKPSKYKKSLKVFSDKIVKGALKHLNLSKKDEEYIMKNTVKLADKFILKMKKSNGKKEYSSSQLVLEDLQEIVNEDKYIVNNMLKDVFKELTANRKWNDLYNKVYKKR